MKFVIKFSKLPKFRTIKRCYLYIFGAFLPFLLQSCIRDYEITEGEKVAQIEKFERFAKNKAQRKSMKISGSDLTYQYAFRDLYHRYYELHPEKTPDFGNPEIDLADFRFSTQVFIEPDSSKSAIFPIINSRKVVGLFVAKINNEETFLEFYKAKITDVTEPVLSAFSQNLEEIQTNGGEGEGEYPEIGEIQEVIIPFPPKPQDFPLKQSEECGDLSDYMNEGCGGPPPSTCIPYQNCGDPFISGTPQGPTPPTPCKTITTVGKHIRTKTLLGDLRTKSTEVDLDGKYKETSYTLTSNTDGSITEQPYIGIPGTNEMKFSLSNQIDGYIHNHNPGGFSIFSPHDLASLSLMYKMGKIKDINSFVFGVVTTAGTQYIITIENSAAFGNFASNFVANGQINESYVKQLDEKYYMNGITTGNNNITGNEAGLLNILQQSNSGLKILKGDSTFSNWNIIQKGSNDQIIKTNCN